MRPAMKEAPLPKPQKSTSKVAKGKAYPVAIVGERNYQDAIAAIGEGEDVVLFHEPDNPYDDRAIAVVCHGDTIGYLARDSWLHAALLAESKPLSARVHRINRGDDGQIGVTLEVSLAGEPLRERRYMPA